MTEGKVVSVTYNPETGQLVLDPPTVAVGNGAWVVWCFESLETGWLPYIRFTTRFGPFHSLRSWYDPDKQRMCFIGKGNLGPSELKDFTYTAWALDPAAGRSVASGTGTVHNAATLQDTSPEARVTFNPEAPQSQRIRVSPEILSLSPGDTATWEVGGMPPGAFATLHFKTPDGEPMRGPFTAFYLVPGDGQGTARASGIGFAVKEAEPVPDRFTYSVCVWDAEGKLLDGHDPAIDNIGPPIPPPDGDGEG
jgi:hypothetical protein